MSEAGKMEGEAMVLDGAKRSGEIKGPEADRLASLPLEALLYYVMYGDEGLRRLT